MCGYVQGQSKNRNNIFSQYKSQKSQEKTEKIVSVLMLLGSIVRVLPKKEIQQKLNFPLQKME